MTKTRRERRAEAVGRLRNLRHHTSTDILYGALGWGHEPHTIGDAEKALIDLLSEDECEDVGDHYEFKCSACGARIDVTDNEGDPTMWDKDWNAAVPSFCPSCGACASSTSSAEAGQTNGDKSRVLVSVGPESETMGLETDSREKLEDDLFTLTKGWRNYNGNYMHVYSSVAFAQVKELLDRQTAITIRECMEACEASDRNFNDIISKLKTECDELREKHGKIRKLLRHCTSRIYALKLQINHQRDATAEMVEDMWRKYKHATSAGKTIYQRAENIAKRLKETRKERDELQCKLDGSIELPKDADGKTVNVGDRLDEGTAKSMTLTEDGWQVTVENEGCCGFRNPSTLHHYHAPTVADVLTDFARDFDDIGGAPDEDELWEKLVSKYADKLQLKEGE